MYVYNNICKDKDITDGSCITWKTNAVNVALHVLLLQH